MDNTNRNFKGQQRDEKVLCFSRKHWVVIFPHILVLFLVPLLIAALFMVKAGNSALPLDPIFFHILAFVVVIFLTYLLQCIFTRFFNYYLQIMIITDYRIIDLDKTLFFRDSRDAVDLSKIQDTIMKRNGIITALLNFGDIIITLPAVNMVKRIKHVPNPDYYFRKINKTKRQYVVARQERSKAGLTDSEDLQEHPLPSASNTM